jgi:hypothetical protein
MAMRKDAWTDEQKNYLLEIVGTDQLPQVMTKFRSHAKRHGWPERTDAAIKYALYGVAASARPEDDGWTAWGLAELLDIDPYRVSRWIRKGFLNTQKNKTRYRIRRENFAGFAKDRPELVSDVARDRLIFFLEPSEVDAIVLVAPKRTRGVPQAVRNKKTGRVYRTLTEAAKTEPYVREHIRWLCDRPDSDFELCKTTEKK